jgi:hypothetical protein
MARNKPQSKRATSPKQDLPGQVDLEEAIAAVQTAVEALPVETMHEVLPKHIDGTVVDGEFMGQPYEHALGVLLDRVHDALADASLEGAAAVVDMAMAEILIMNKLEYGPFHAREAALRFIATALPYVDLEEIEPKTFGEAMLRIAK